MTHFTTNGKVIASELYTPIAGSLKPGFIVIAYGTDGMTEPWGTKIREYANALSQQGSLR